MFCSSTDLDSIFAPYERHLASATCTDPLVLLKNSAMVFRVSLSLKLFLLRGDSENKREQLYLI